MGCCLRDVVSGMLSPGCCQRNQELTRSARSPPPSCEAWESFLFSGACFFLPFSFRFAVLFRFAVSFVFHWFELCCSLCVPLSVSVSQFCVRLVCLLWFFPSSFCFRRCRVAVVPLLLLSTPSPATNSARDAGTSNPYQNVASTVSVTSPPAPSRSPLRQHRLGHLSASAASITNVRKTFVSPKKRSPQRPHLKTVP